MKSELDHTKRLGLQETVPTPMWRDAAFRLDWAEDRARVRLERGDPLRMRIIRRPMKEMGLVLA